MRAAVLALLLAAPAAAIPATDLVIRQSTPQLSYRWRIAPEAAFAPALLKSLRAEALRTAAKQKSAATRDEAGAKKAGFPFRRYEMIEDWSLAADTGRLLALVDESYAYTGGAHGNTRYAVRLWDKQAGRVIKFADLFSDWPKARKLLEPAYCKALDAERATRRGGEAGGGSFNDCPKLSEQPLTPWGPLWPNAGAMRVLLAPYVAGSYAEGSYKIDVPWPEGIRALVKPAYRKDLLGDG